jgi:hypothetical protein
MAPLSHTREGDKQIDSGVLNVKPLLGRHPRAREGILQLGNEKALNTSTDVAWWLVKTIWFWCQGGKTGFWLEPKGEIMTRISRSRDYTWFNRLEGVLDFRQILGE